MVFPEFKKLDITTYLELFGFDRDTNNRLRIKKLFSSHQHFTTKAEGQKYRESSNETDTMEMQLCNMCVAPQCVSYWLALSR